MPVELRLPQVAEGMTTARVSAWLKREGETITAGEAVAEVETDKTSVEIEAPSAGVLGAILVAAGTEDVPVGTVLAVIEDAGSVRLPPSPERRRTGQPDDQVRRKPDPTSDLTVRIPATPLAAAMAAAAGLDLAAIPSTGERVCRSDVEHALGRTSSGTAAAGPALPAAPRGRTTGLTAARRITAERLQRAKQTVPHFYLEIECDASALVQRRRELNARAGTAPLTVTDFIVFAAARALRDVPGANASWLGPDDGIRLFETADIAVAVNAPSGLVTPVVRRADTRTLDAIARELHALVMRARDGRLAPAEYAGGTFTISNLGMFGLRSLYPIVNPPQGAILGVGAILDRPVVRGGRVEPGAVLTCTFAGDHRAMDGATGAQFLQALKTRLEDADTLQS